MARRKTTPVHGTNACYLKGCRRPECRAASYATSVARERAILRGEWEPFTDAGPVRDHVAALVRAGLTEKNVADLAGVAPGSMFHLMHGSSGRPGRRMRHEAAAAILAVRPPSAAIPASGVIPSTGTIRRLRALVARGWPQARLADELGMQRTNLGQVMRSDRVRASTAAAVREAYGRLWDVPPPQATVRQRADAERARALAEANGWVPPAAWDDDVIDDPDGRPADGWKRPARARLRSAELAEEAGDLFRREGYTREHAAERLGVSLSALEAALRRARLAQEYEHEVQRARFTAAATAPDYEAEAG